LPGKTWATITLTDSASDSKLQMEVGVKAGFKYGDAAGASFVESILFSERSEISKKSFRTGDLVGNVLERLMSLLLLLMTDAPSGEGTRAVLVEGNKDNRGEDVTTGEVALRGRVKSSACGLSYLAVGIHTRLKI
jgi:hypothetical protein